VIAFRGRYFAGGQLTRPAAEAFVRSPVLRVFPRRKLEEAGIGVLRHEGAQVQEVTLTQADGRTVKREARIEGTDVFHELTKSAERTELADENLTSQARAALLAYPGPDGPGRGHVGESRCSMSYARLLQVSPRRPRGRG
jgi:hypothetical protein